MFATASYSRTTKPSDAVYLWLENINGNGFKACIREFLPFDGKHQDTIVVGTYTFGEMDFIILYYNIA